MTDYTTNSKEVLRDGKHFADAQSPDDATLIAERMNAGEWRSMDSAPKTEPIIVGCEQGNEWHCGIATWIFGDWFSIGTCTSWRPTAWLPLPALPEDAA